VAYPCIFCARRYSPPEDRYLVVSALLSSHIRTRHTLQTASRRSEFNQTQSSHLPGGPLTADPYRLIPFLSWTNTPALPSLCLGKRRTSKYIGWYYSIRQLYYDRSSPCNLFVLRSTLDSEFRATFSSVFFRKLARRRSPFHNSRGGQWTATKVCVRSACQVVRDFVYAGVE
jgi:hypothetical protein